MNWIWIVVIAVMGGCIWNGHRRGMIKTLFSLFSAIIALALTAIFAPVVSRQLQQNEKLCAYVEEKVESSLGGYLDELGESSTAAQNEAIKGLPLPETIREKLVANKNIEVYRAMAVDSLEQYVVKYVTNVMINAGSFVAVFLLVNFALLILAHVLNIISKLPVLNTLNKTLGAAGGFLQGLVILWILCVVLTIFSSSEAAKGIFAQINGDPVLSYIYNHNLLLQTVSDVVKLLR